MAINQAFNFSNKIVLITGGSDGLGYGMARAFLDAGATVHVTGTKTQDQYDKDYSDMTFHQLNVINEREVQALARQFSELDVLVNSVGAVLYKKQEFERAGFEKVLTINLIGVMDLCTSLLPAIQSRKGNIINIDSAASIRPSSSVPAYSASKAGLKHLTKSLAQRWGRKGVRVNGISPGLIPTKMTANQTSDEEQEKQFAAMCPLGRFGEIDEVAGSALFLASPMASYITGHSIVIDGGISI